MPVKKVGIVFGGQSGEHEVSLMSAESVIQFLPRDRYEPVLIGITKCGGWLTEGNPWEALKQGTKDPGGPAPTALLSSLDVIFPVLHGPYGEDGTIQGLFEMCGVAYVGADVLASSIGMDKVIMKQIFRANNFPIAAYTVAWRRHFEEDPESVLEDIVAKLGLPVFVKPANLGSSVGVSKANDTAELAQALKLACSYDRKVIVEEYIPCREIECSVLGNDFPEASIIGEIVPHNEFYDYGAKYSEGGSDLLIPAPVPAAVSEEVRALAVAAFQAIDCSGMARVDFFIHRDTGRVILNEINTIPGFTRYSMYPRLWQATGLSYPDLIDRLLVLALERFSDRRRNAT